MKESVNFVKVLSIDPAKAPAASMHPELTIGFLRRRGIARRAIWSRNEGVASLVFGRSLSLPRSQYVLGLRLSVAISLIVAGVIQFYWGEYSATAVGAALSVAAGMAIGMGFFSRVVSVAVSVMFLWLATAMAIAGTVPGVEVLVAVSSAVLAVTGPGKYSVDRTLKHAMVRRMGRRGVALDHRAFSRMA